MKLMQADQLGSLLAVLKVNTEIDIGKCAFQLPVACKTVWEDEEERAEKPECGGKR